jgi:hypothetical protein
MIEAAHRVCCKNAPAGANTRVSRPWQRHIVCALVVHTRGTSRNASTRAVLRCAVQHCPYQRRTLRPSLASMWCVCVLGRGVMRVSGFRRAGSSPFLRPFALPIRDASSPFGPASSCPRSAKNVCSGTTGLHGKSPREKGRHTIQRPQQRSFLPIAFEVMQKASPLASQRSPRLKGLKMFFALKKNKNNTCWRRHLSYGTVDTVEDSSPFKHDRKCPTKRGCRDDGG